MSGTEDHDGTIILDDDDVNEVHDTQPVLMAELGIPRTPIPTAPPLPGEGRYLETSALHLIDDLRRADAPLGADLRPRRLPQMLPPPMRGVAVATLLGAPAGQAPGVMLRPGIIPCLSAFDDLRRWQVFPAMSSRAVVLVVRTRLSSRFDRDLFNSMLAAFYIDERPGRPEETLDRGGLIDLVHTTMLNVEREQAANIEWFRKNR
jgi:hypothetical protein